MALASKVFATAALCTSALLVPASVAAAPASASTSGPVTIAANACGLPTHATPPSKFIRSYGNCNTCIRDAAKMTTSDLFGRRYYCTYNPSNDLNDLHQYLG